MRYTPAGTDISQVYLPSNIRLAENSRPDFQGGLVTLQGKAILMPEKDWESGLYQPVSSMSGKIAEIQMIPYFAWSNRNVRQMTVWVPVIWD